MTVWSIAKWPVLVLVAAVAFRFYILLATPPNARQPSIHRESFPARLAAVILWIAASIGFALYVANFASYNKTYGSLGKDAPIRGARSGSTS